MTPDETREALAAMVREGKAAGMYADDHGAAGFCTDHGQPALDAAAIRARAIHDLDNLPAKSRPAWYRTRVNGDDAWWESLVQTECEVGHVVYVDDGDGTVYACPACALVARDAEVERLRAVGPIAWTFGQRARADRAEATVAKVEAECERWLSSLGRPAPDRLDFWTNGARAFAEHVAALGLTVTDTPTEALCSSCHQSMDAPGCCTSPESKAEYPQGFHTISGGTGIHTPTGAHLRPLPRERDDAVLDSGPTDPDEGADCG